jgi:hypothetical protein
MTTLDRRVTALETKRGPEALPGLVLFLRDEPTPAERAAIAQAEAEGRVVLLVVCVDASVPEPDTAKEMQ